MPDCSCHQLGVDCFDLRNLLHHFRNCFISCLVIVVDWIANKENGFDVLQSLHLRKLFPSLDLVVADEKGVKLHTWLQVKLLDVVVRDPELFKRLTNVFQSLESPDLIAAKRKDFEVLKARKRNHLVNSVSGQRELRDVFELIQRIIQSIDGVGKLADET